MEQKERESENIELRSEKVRNVIGKVPPRLVSLGTVIITIIVPKLTRRGGTLPITFLTFSLLNSILSVSFSFCSMSKAF